jgi:pimeloyl-ACP methyl ester carboxylesterase
MTLKGWALRRASLVALFAGLAIQGADPAWAQAPSPAARPAATPKDIPGLREIRGTAPNGALWEIEAPANWNGVLILQSHGYFMKVQAPNLRGGGGGDWLLEHGFALAASSYSKSGWAIAEALPDQLAVLDEFETRFGKPKRTIASGDSMGGLISIALIERFPQRITAAVTSCGSISGSLGMLNMALDGGFAFKTLAAPDSALQLVRIDNDMVNNGLARKLLQEAQASPAGRARIALAATLAQLPPWSDTRLPEPKPDDYEAQEAQMASAFPLGGMLPRQDQEQRAGGNFSWNTGVDYRRQLERSGRRAFVEAMYRKAGLSLDRDLDSLAAAPRIAADPAAVAYMRANYVPSGEISGPVFSFHTIGDGATMVTKQGAYRDMVRTAGHGDLFAAGWVRRAGHCTFTPAEQVAAIETVVERLDTGRWNAAPDALNARAKATGLGESAFIAFTPAPFLRPCSGREAACAGEPPRRTGG